MQLQLPDDPYFFQQFYGMLDQATQWFAYDRDTAKTGRLVAAYWKQVIRSIQFCPPPELVGPGFSVGEDMQIKQDPDNPCLVREVCPDGSLGCVVIDISKCLTNPAPGGGIKPPSQGNCQEYNINYFANALVLLPFLVNSGDTLTIISETGAGNDGGLTWFCPDGGQFAAGACVGGYFLQPSDPLPSVFHMATVLKVNGIYHKFTSGVFTVPSGIVNLPIYIGVNDAPIADNWGTYLIDFTYCNNQAIPSTPWCHNSNFTATPDGWSAPGYPGGGGFCETGTLPSGLWSSGNGWQGQDYHQSDCTDLSVLTYIALDLGVATPLTEITLDFNLETVAHPFDSWEIFGSTTLDNSGDVGLASASNPGTGPKSVVWTGTATYRYIKISLIKLQSAGSSPTATITSVQVKGTGTNPFGTSNC